LKPSLKIAVYTIALNEEKHVKRWFDSARDADLLLIADTGSTDKTRFVAKSLGITVHEVEVKPWRFDVARNASLALIPEDYDICIQLDMDEVLSEGWREKVEEAFSEGNNWPLYKHVTSRFEDGTIRAFQMYFKIHPRRGFFWKYPIHEVLTHSPEVIVVRKEINLEVDHLQDKKKSRHSYLNLLELAVNEEPKDWRMNHYLNREYFYNRDWVKVLQSAYVCEKISGGWDVERASTYMWASEAALNLKFPGLAEHWAEQATLAAPKFYEAWHWRAHIAHLHEKWFDCLHYASKLQFLQRQTHHLVKPSVWEWWGYDLIALSNYKLENYSEALVYGEMAFLGAKENLRLRENLEFYKKSFLDSIPKQHLSRVDKIEGLPQLFVINLEEDKDRLCRFEENLKLLGINNWAKIAAVKVKGAEERALNLAITESHLIAIKKFLSDEHLSYSIICEDDLSLAAIDSWNFTWKQLIERVKVNRIDILQLSLITKSTSTFQSGLRRRRKGIDWSSGAYLISRSGARLILDKNCNLEKRVGINESDLFDDLDVYVFACLVCDTSSKSAAHQSHIQKYHVPSFKKTIENLEIGSLHARES
jgi:glycosyltransferase involved in cell wall biosynthesis